MLVNTRPQVRLATSTTRPRAITPTLIAVCAALTLGVLATLAGSSWADAPETELISISSAGGVANAASFGPAVSDDGRIVVFTSDATDLAPADSNSRDVFAFDRSTGLTTLVTVASDGTQANRPAQFPDVSGNGRYVVYQSDSDNLVAGDTNGDTDIFLYDLLTGITERISVANDGSEANRESTTPSISADGRYVVFTSLASNLAPGDTNADLDVYLRDRVAGTTELISVSSSGEIGNNPSGGLGAGLARVTPDGRYVVFGSFADNLVAGDDNLRDDVFLRDRVAGTTDLISVSSGGIIGNGHSLYPDISDDGSLIVYYSFADNLVADDTNGESDVFLCDRTTGITSRLSTGLGGAPPDGLSHFPSISSDGTHAVFPSDATNLVADDTNGQRDIFLLEIGTTNIRRVNMTPSGGESGGPSSSAAINGSGATVAYQSFAANLIVGDDNGGPDIFAWAKPLATPPTPTPLPASQPGDADCSTTVTAIDAALVLQFTAGLFTSLPCPAAADANSNGAVDAIDAALILQFVAGLVTEL